MSELLSKLLPAMATAAFLRRTDGSFVALAPLPAWFTRIASDTTFPFLGHILEEAQTFWRSGVQGSNDFGPCAADDESGAEFHYKVTALSAEGSQYLVFQLDPGADRMREVLQKIRNEGLSAERDASSHEAVATELRTINKDIKDLLRLLLTSNPTPEQTERLNTLAALCVRQMGGVTKLIRATVPHV